MKIVILYSGGMDSFILRHYAQAKHPDAEIVCVYYKHGNEAEEHELANLPDFVDVKTIDMVDKEQVLLGDTNHIIPGRNMVFLAHAASKYLPDEIWMGSVKGEDLETSTDKNETFCRMMEELLNYVLAPYANPVKIVIPFVRDGLDKSLCLEWALNNGISLEEIMATKSCYSGEYAACGKCRQCFKRWALFGHYGKSEGYEYPVYQSEVGLMHIRAMLDGNKPGYTYELIDNNKTIFPFVLNHILENAEYYPNDIVEKAKGIKHEKD